MTSKLSYISGAGKIVMLALLFGLIGYASMMTQQASHMQSEVSGLQDEVTQLQDNLKTSSNVTLNLRQEMEALDDEINSYKERIINYQFQLATFEEGEDGGEIPSGAAGPSPVVTDLAEKLSEAKKIEKRLREDRKSLRDRVTQLETENEFKLKEVDVISQQLNDMKNQYSDVISMEKNFNEQVSDFQKVKKESLLYMGKIQELEDQLTKYKDQLSSAAERRRIDLENEQKRLTAKHEKELTRIKNNLEQKHENLAKAQEERVDLRGLLTETQRDVRKTLKELSHTNKEKMKMIRELVDLHYNLGVMLTEKNEFSKAVLSYQKVLELEPNDADTHYNMAILYDDQLDDSTKALWHYQEYLRIRPQAKEAQQVRKWIVDKSSEVMIRDHNSGE